MEEIEINEVGKLRIWWIPQVPMKNPFKIVVQDLHQARFLLNTLAGYDDYQFKNKIKPDYSNVGGLEVYEKNGDGFLEWVEWHCNECGEDIDSCECK